MSPSKWLRATFSCALAALSLASGALAQVAENPTLAESAVAARNSYMSGRVLSDCDANPLTTGDRVPLPGVTILLRKGMRTVATTTSNGLGQYRFNRIPADTYDILAIPPAGGASVAVFDGDMAGRSAQRLSDSAIRVLFSGTEPALGNDFIVAEGHESTVTSEVSPMDVVIEDQPVSITVTGENFTPCSVIRLDGHDLPTTFVSAVQLKGMVARPEAGRTSSTKELTVFTPGVTASVSSPLPLSVRRSYYEIHAEADAGGTITPSGEVKVNPGATQLFVIAPTPGSAIEHLFVDNVDIIGQISAAERTSSYTYRGFTNVQADHDIEAYFSTGLAPSVCAVSPTETITQRRPKVQIPIVVRRSVATPIMLFSVNFTLTDLRTSVADIVEGDFMSSGSAPSAIRSFKVTDLGNNNYQVDGIVSGASCGSSALNANLFTVGVTSGQLNGFGGLTLNSVRMRDCTNYEQMVRLCTDACKVIVDQCSPTVQVLQPNGGSLDTLRIGTIRQIKWSATDLAGIAAGRDSSIKIEYSTDGGTTWSAVANNLANSGSYDWTVPAPPTANGRVRIWALDAFLNKGFDVSDSSFTILQPTLSQIAADANNSTVHEESQKFTVTVTNKAPLGTPAITPTGKVRLFQDGVLFDTQSLDASGKATFNKPMSIGTHELYAIYDNDLTHEASWTQKITYQIFGRFTMTVIGNGSIADLANLAGTNLSNNSSTPATRSNLYPKDAKPVIGLSPTKLATTLRSNRVKRMVFNGVEINPIVLKYFVLPTTGIQGNNTFLVEFAPMAPLSDLAAEQLRQGNDRDGTTKIKITWSDSAQAGTTVMVYRKPYGGYPLYNALGAIPALPDTADEATLAARGWVLTDVHRSGEMDEPAARDFYYYFAVVVDTVQAWRSRPSPMTVGTLNYHLGDVACANCNAGLPGDNLVAPADLAMINSYYGLSGAALNNVRPLDIGPTTGSGVNGRPLPDNRIDFEDLAIASMNNSDFGGVGVSRARPAPAASDAVELVVPDAVQPGMEFPVKVNFSGTGNIQAMSVQLSWDPAVVEPIGYTAGDRVLSQDGIVLSPKPGTVDGASFAGAGKGLAGEGEFATIRFRVKKAGDARIDFARIDARDSQNQKVELNGRVSFVAQPKVSATALAPAMPNPFNQRTTFLFSLAKSGPAELQVFSVDGRLVRHLASGVRAAGEYRLEWDGRDDAGRAIHEGVYYARLNTQDGKFTRVVTFLK